MKANEPEYEITERQPRHADNKLTIIKYNSLLYFVWLIAAVIATTAAMWSAVVGAWGWALGWGVGALVLAAHARIERLDGHRHLGGRNLVE